MTAPEDQSAGPVSRRPPDSRADPPRWLKRALAFARALTSGRGPCSSLVTSRRRRPRLESVPMKRGRPPATSSGISGRSGRRRGSPNRDRTRRGEEVERPEAERLADIGWVEWGGELIWAAGFTAGGAPFGLRACELDPAELKAMGLVDAAPASARARLEEADDWLPGGERGCE
jgi:hypothetical protein